MTLRKSAAGRPPARAPRRRRVQPAQEPAAAQDGPQDRVPGVREGRLVDLAPDPMNANRGTERGGAMLEDSLRRYGAGRSVVVDRRGVIIGGNKTVAAALRAGLDKVLLVESAGERLVVVQRTDLDLEADPRAAELALADNRAQEVSLEWDPAVLQQLAAAGAELGRFWTAQELVQVARGARPDAPKDPGPQVHRADELQAEWQTARGQTWEIPSSTVRGGAHRLRCGDSTDLADVGSLFDGARAALFATDPPYLIDYTGADRPTGTGKDWSDLYREVDITDALAFFRGTFTAAREVCEDHAAWYCWHAHKRFTLIEQVWRELGILSHQQIIWVKPLPNVTYSMWAWRHEPCLMGWKAGHRPAHNGARETKGGAENTTVWYVDPAETDVWELDWEGKVRHRGKDHPTEKPVEIFRRPMRKHTALGAICYEPFAGSGSQFVAAEQLGRLCYGLELEPAFVAVVLQRCADMGLAPRLAGA